MHKHLLITVGLLGLVSACELKEDSCGNGYARADDGNCYPINTDGESDEDEVSEDGNTGGATGNQDTGAPSGGDTEGATDGGATDAGTTDGGATSAGATDGGSSSGGTTGDGDLDGLDEGPPDEGIPDEGPPDEGIPDEGIPDEGIPDEGIPDEGAPDEGAPDEGGISGDTGDIFEITAECDGPFAGTTASGSLRDWVGSGPPIDFASAAWRWKGSADTATVLITQEEDTCSDEVIAAITAGTYEGPAAFIEISNWSTPELDTLEVTPPAPTSEGPSITASAYYFDTDEGTSWPLDGFTGDFLDPTYGKIEINYIELGSNFEGRATLYGGGPGEGVDGNFNACYCSALSSLDMPGETMGGGGDGPPMEDPPEEGEEPPLGDGADPGGEVAGGTTG